MNLKHLIFVLGKTTQVMASAIDFPKENHVGLLGSRLVSN